MIGKTISNYKVTSELGKGGMGEVWRAQDTKLGRDVALKVLPDSFAQDPERLERFDREAKVLASLSHSNIAGIYGVEDVDGKRFLVMEVAEGETLSERIARGPIPVADAVKIAAQIAEALEVAHEKGIVHRDLKPGNVMVTDEGKVKVLDFGLAKAMGIHPLSGSSGEDWTQSPTLAPGGTQAGMLLGTAGYMSPEQARGKPVDRRSDIWAFGCVLFEMLGGRKAFDGETVTDVLGAIVHKEPELDKLPADVPRRIKDLIGRCLQKDQSRRLQSIGDARIALQEWIENPGAEEPTAAPAASAAGWRRWLPWGVAAALALALGLQLAGVLGTAGPSAEPIRRFEVRLAASGLDLALGACAVLSPDGARMAYVTGIGNDTSLFIRPLDRFEGTKVTAGINSGAPYHPFFSPDGQWLGFVTSDELKKVSVSGGAPVKLCDVERSRGASWGPNGTIVFAAGQQGGLSLVSAAGGVPEPLTTLDEAARELSHRWPQWLPGGKAVLFTVTNTAGDAETATIEAVDVETRTRTVIHRGGYYARYVPTGHILYVSDGTLFALPFDARRLEAKGASQMPVLEGLAANPGQGAAQFDVSETGLLTYVSGAAGQAPYPISWVDRDGRTQGFVDERGIYANPRLSPNGRRLAYTMLRDENIDVWVYDLERGVPTRITFDEGYDADQIWSPDGKELLFTSTRDGQDKVYRKRADGSGEVALVVDCEAPCFPSSISPDGRTLALISSSNNGDIVLVDMESGKSESYLSTSFLESGPAFSPDGRWIAYVSGESGAPEIYVQSFPAGGGKWQVSAGTGAEPRWAANGRELFFRTNEGLMVAAVQASGGSFQADRARSLFTGAFMGGLAGITIPGYSFPDYDVSSDGKRFVMFPGDAQQGFDVTSVNVVSGWFTELERLASAGGQ